MFHVSSSLLPGVQLRGLSICYTTSYTSSSRPRFGRHAIAEIDNHDQQRQLWKPAKGGPPSSPVCRWDPKQIL